jgi:hypothetical protein
MKTMAVALVLLSFNAAQVSPPQAPEKIGPSARWEYQVLTREQVADLGKKDLAAGLNKLGGEGWELVAVDAAYIFKRSRPQGRQSSEDLKTLVGLIESDVELLKDRVSWAERMVRKGYLTDQGAQAERLRLKKAEVALERAQRELRALPPDPKKPAGKEPGSEK